MGAPSLVKSLHHLVWRCRDAEETRSFYEDLLGLPLAHVVRAGDAAQLFFRMGDGSYLAFLDRGDGSVGAPPGAAHVALEVDSPEALEGGRRRLKVAGVEASAVEHHPLVHALAFTDPNGLRVELALRRAPAADEDAKAARAALATWSEDKRRRAEAERDAADSGHA